MRKIYSRWWSEVRSEIYPGMGTGSEGIAILVWEIIECLSGVTSEQRPREGEAASNVDMRRTLDGGNSHCKNPEAEACLPCSENSKKWLDERSKLGESTGDTAEGLG